MAIFRENMQAYGVPLLGWIYLNEANDESESQTESDVEWIDPRQLKPTETPGKKRTQKIAQNIADEGYDESQPIEVVEYEGELLIKNGHHRARAAIMAGEAAVPIVRVQVSAAEAQALQHGSFNAQGGRGF